MQQIRRLPPELTIFERGWLSSNNLLFAGRGATALVDSGQVAHAAQTVALVGQALAGRPLNQIFNTHLHSDHCGGNAALQAAWPKVRTAVPAGAADAARRWDTKALGYAALGQDCPRFRTDAVLAPGSSVCLGERDWQVHAAPGHDADAVLLFEPEARVLVSGDALWQDGFGAVFPDAHGHVDFAAVAATLDRIEALQPTTVVPGHGRVFGEGYGPGQGIGSGEVAQALATARRRLAAFVRDPRRHAVYAGKVLLKFHLLAVQRTDRAALHRWAAGASCLDQLRAVAEPALALPAWCDALLADLQRSGAARLDGDGRVFKA